MISHELAKRLKELGVKQEGRHWICEHGETEEGRAYAASCNCQSYYQPTLSELIEACGKGFINLVKSGSEYHCNWFDEGPGENTIGKTPEEAVANLWLALQKK